MIYFVQGDARKIPLADGTVQCCITSPPYWGLRDYGISDQLGLERTPEEYVTNIVAVFREVWRVLRDDGTVWLNLGDSYSGGSRDPNPNGKQGTNRGTVEFNPGFFKGFVPDGLKPKDLVGIPWRVAFALQADGWYLRSDIIWAKPNPMPESVTDRPTKAHEYVFLLSKRAQYYYDAEAVREPVQEVTLRRLSQPNFDNQTGGAKDPKNGGKGSVNRSERRTLENLKERYSKEGVWTDRQTGYELWKERGIGRNRRTVWTIATQPYSGAHFATFPEALVEPCILAGTSERGCCPRCGKPWVRVVERKEGDNLSWAQAINMSDKHAALVAGGMRGNGSRLNRGDKETYYENSAKYTTLGWRADCTCNAGDPVPCLVLDPFSGSGTTGLVAEKHRRRFVGVELSAEYIQLARKRTAEIQPVMPL